MPYNFTVSPDFGPDHLAGWYVFNTWVQRILGEAVHLEIYRDFASQRRAIDAGDVDLILNPCC
jgi:phosphonate transport system substrate-binding protein